MSDVLATRPLASVSLDSDDLWSYMKTHGDPEWERRPSYLRQFFPIATDALDEVGIKITFFIVGFDAARQENHEVISSLVKQGHEVANHSFQHEPWLHLYSRQQLEEEIASAEQAIQEATGMRTVGFRGPGYSWCEPLLEVLVQRGYLYDASTLPTYIGPLARAYYFASTKPALRDSPQRKALFGTMRDGLRPVKPYRWRLPGARTLLEIPVTTVPLVKIPFHVSYLLYLANYSEALAFTYFRSALLACRLAGVEPSFLLHPLDLLGGDQVRELAFFPGMTLTGTRKRQLFVKALRILGEHFTLVDMSTHARAILARDGLEVRTPDVAAPLPSGVVTG